MTYQVVIVPSATRTRVLVTDGPDELLRAVLPSSSQLRYKRATTTVLESLALWLNAKLHVVLSVDAKDAGFCLGLTDELGVGVRSLFARPNASKARHNEVSMSLSAAATEPRSSTQIA